MGKIQSRQGLTIHYEVDGAGPPVVLLHGMGGNYQTSWIDRGWRDLLSHAGFTVIGIDARGCGLSSSLDDPRDFREGAFLQDVLAVLDATNVETATFIGYSMGAGHALRFGLVHPHRVRALVLGGLGGIALAMAGIYHRSGANSRRALQAGQVGVESGIGERSPRLAPYAAAYFEALQQDALSAGQLESLRMPVLLCVGSEDVRQGDFAALSVSESLAERIPQAHRVVFENEGHGTLVASASFKSTVLQFVRGVVSAGAEGG